MTLSNAYLICFIELFDVVVKFIYFAKNYTIAYNLTQIETEIARR